MELLTLLKLAKKFAKHPETPVVSPNLFYSPTIGYPCPSVDYGKPSLPTVKSLDDSIKNLETQIEQTKKRQETIKEYEDFLVELDRLIEEFSDFEKYIEEGIIRARDAAEEAGVSLEELIYLVKSLQQRTARGGAVIGNSLKTIFTRLTRKSTINLLKALNIKTEQSAIKILRELASKLPTLSPKNQRNLEFAVAGTYNAAILKTLLSELKFPINNC